ncbi:hypothetical protein THAOC_04657 [Thalassiosira oceanica]|uniref:Uncharacterized protein n=1 Tax=Thalassiosira oceanica TaxID=159749 RepID=K0T9H9_THAOC|nr:hypothetical protein THAOC_04657 [Thalassiosira oceanica]|eukprot:EJK73704.1 hypothetical protein THAOC_04657 [Thalassiosira oceanica]
MTAKQGSSRRIEVPFDVATAPSCSSPFGWENSWRGRVLPRCPRCDMQTNFANSPNHEFLEWKAQYAAAAKNVHALEVEFTVYGETLERMEVFKYLGRLMAMDEKDMHAVQHNLKKARGVWRRFSILLRSEKLPARVCGMFYKAVIQSVLLYMTARPGWQGLTDPGESKGTRSIGGVNKQGVGQSELSKMGSLAQSFILLDSKCLGVPVTLPEIYAYAAPVEEEPMPKQTSCRVHNAERPGPQPRPHDHPRQLLPFPPGLTPSVIPPSSKATPSMPRLSDVHYLCVALRSDDPRASKGAVEREERHNILVSLFFAGSVPYKYKSSEGGRSVGGTFHKTSSCISIIHHLHRKTSANRPAPLYLHHLLTPPRRYAKKSRTLFDALKAFSIRNHRTGVNHRNGRTTRRT